ncbi:hypothetical protein GQX73_g3165 [Xylaria multiplex]|uniref:Uncharacterized protein n=1 Tax=Xylaria multiplex TaxID=323545 RepID=A0A7C8MWY8_9PEZI|nr:hypothetical protein GQX73_g3165 [Xylaria multiplex]
MKSLTCPMNTFQQHTVPKAPTRREKRYTRIMAVHEYEDPPPSYAEATGANQDSGITRRHTATGTSGTALNPLYFRRRSAATLFPPAFSLYIIGPRQYMIGESQLSPLYAVSTHSSLSPKPDVVIHNDISQDCPPLATIEHEPFSRSASITLPARAGARVPVASEPLESAGAFARIMSFSIETGASGRSRESFEWRHSSGVEVEALGGRHSGWKLVRVSAPPIRVGKKHHHHNNNSALGHSSDGKEIVAVWAGANMSVSKILRFRFLGSGADGSLGERWAVMAVATALAIWNRDRRSRSGGSTFRDCIGAFGDGSDDERSDGESDGDGEDGGEDEDGEDGDESRRQTQVLKACHQNWLP